ncbi:MAG: hypothetical protein PHX18_08970 [Candidatus Gastranaerophilales bacterium]|nr:hypothetical protein [Candidatus Gastranaerophilales bacterium]
MGIAASQARYLYLTARQTNVEFEGQQINQARTNLANEQAGLFQEMLTLEPPSTKTLYEITQDLSVWSANTPPGPNPASYSGGEKSPDYIMDRDIWLASDGGTDANAAYQQYLTLNQQKEQEYQLALDQINAKSEELHQKDRVLELQLRQLDTEQQTIITELESVKKVIDKNIENVFKTFQ